MNLYASSKFTDGEAVPDYVQELQKLENKNCSVLFISQFIGKKYTTNDEYQKVMNHLGYKVFTMQKKASFLEFLTRASSCKYSEGHKLRYDEKGNCSWCFN